MTATVWGAFLTVLAMMVADDSRAACRQALALGLDVSGSVDAREYRLQMDGLAAALEHPEVQKALFAMPDAPVTLAVFDWSGPADQRMVQDWMSITSTADLSLLTNSLRGTIRTEGEISTAIGSAKLFGAQMLARQPQCWRRVLDLSGDGPSNTGPLPRDVRPDGITINGLVIGASQDADGIGALSSYYRAYVVQGTDAFIETALGFDAFEDAMVRKLIRELQVIVVSERP